MRLVTEIHLVKEKGGSLLRLHCNLTTFVVTDLAFAAVAAVGDLVAVTGVPMEEHGCTLCLSLHCVEVNVHLEISFRSQYQFCYLLTAMSDFGRRWTLIEFCPLKTLPDLI